MTVNNVLCCESKTKVRPHDHIHLEIPEVAESHMKGETIPLDILFEDDHILVLNKPAGLVVHPGAGNPSGTLVNALVQHCGDSLSGVGGVRRPGIVHRLDKDTCGLMVVAKSDEAHHNLVEQFHNQTIGREYVALVWGIVKGGEGFVDQPIGRHRFQRQKMTIQPQSGKPARTDYFVEQVIPPFMSLLRCALHSGRTHQIRVHMASLGHGVVGDPVYGRPVPLPQTPAAMALKDFLKSHQRQALQAQRLYFLHPISKENLEFEINTDEYLLNIIDYIQKI